MKVSLFKLKKIVGLIIHLDTLKVKNRVTFMILILSFQNTEILTIKMIWLINGTGKIEMRIPVTEI